MVRGRAGGTGAPFNLGEMTVTRCTVELHDGPIGHAYIRGRATRHAELAAVLDAMLQDRVRHDTVDRQVIRRLAAAQAERRRRAEARAAATRVEFLTLVRGE
jgi:alpha-D-ribose 1-methylphosphonate 5-triphosphate synthase subunit PhnG